ncbi:leucine-rich repeat-containing protein 23 [Aplochiton taeniatus]
MADEEDVVLSDGEEGAHEGGIEGESTDHEDQVELCPLTQETIIEGLSLLCKTGNGLVHAFIKADLKDRRLTDIVAITAYVHLRFLDISSNHLSDLAPLVALTHLLWVKGDRNMVTTFKEQKLDQLTYLQWLSLAGNRLSDLEGLGGPALESLNLIGNGIQRVYGLQYSHLTNLMTLELRGNRLDTTDGIYLPNLRRLYLAQNGIKRLEGLGKLERLTTLHLRDNQLETLEGISPNMRELQYLNVRGNLIFNQNALRSLQFVSKTLRALVLAENPLLDTDDYRISVLTRLPHLERLDKEPVSTEERSEALEKAKGEVDNF